jgi:succinoglycan biosynthesis transport protein ExoP
MAQTQSSEATLHAVDYWQVLKNRYGVILLTFLLVFMTAAVITYVMPKKYESVAVVQVNPRTPDMHVFGGMYSESAGAALMTHQFFGTEFEVIKAQKTLMMASEALDLTTRWGVDRETSLSMLRGIVDTQNIRGTDLIRINVRHTNAEDARDVAIEVAKAYRDRRADLEDERAQEALDKLNKALREQEDRVEEKRKVLNTIVETKGIVYKGGDSIFGGAPVGADEDMVARSASMTFEQLEQEKVQLESQIQTLLKYSSDDLIEFAAGLNLPENTVKNLQPQYADAKQGLIALRASGLGNRHPRVLAQREIIEDIRLQLQDGVGALRNTLRAQLELTKERLTKMESLKQEREEAAVKTGIDTYDFVEARKEFEQAREMFDTMRIKYQGERIQLELPRNPIVIHEEPTLARAPVSPNVTLNLVLGAVVGLVFGIGIAFFLEYLDTSVKTLEDVERHLQVPVLAVIPKDVGVLHKQSGVSPDAEAYRILRTNIEFNRKNPEDNAITVVSGGAGEGKSTTLVNLAYICAQGGYTTLMVDADLRRPRLHTFFDISNSVGLTNYLTTDLMLEDVVLQTPVDNLYFMPSGVLPADAAGILNSRRMSELVQDVKQRFDLVLIDSPPILGVSDAAVLASEVDLTMIVVQHRKLPRHMLMRTKQAVENVGGQVIGVVLNNVDVRSDSQYQYYTSYYTYYAPSEASQAPEQQTAATQATQKSARKAEKPSAAPADGSSEDLY